MDLLSKRGRTQKFTFVSGSTATDPQTNDKSKAAAASQS